MKEERGRLASWASLRDKAWKSPGELDGSRFPDRRQTKTLQRTAEAFPESASLHGRIEQTSHGGSSQHHRCSICRCTTIFALVRANHEPSSTIQPYPSSAFLPFQCDHFMFAVHLCLRIVWLYRGGPYPLRANCKDRRDQK
jgi:hypothetical protein